MHKITFYLLLSVSLLMLCGKSASGQSTFSPQTRLLVKQVQELNQPHRADQPFPKKLVTEYDLIKKNNTYTIGALLLVDQDFNKSDLNKIDAKMNSRAGDIVTVRLPIEHLDLLTEINGIKYVETGSSLSPDLELSLPDTRTDSVHSGLGGLSQSYTGDGVIICIIDWGFDYTHPVFYDSALTELRLSRAWDQNKNSGPPPAGYDFGTEYVGKDELITAGSDTGYIFRRRTHGTHVAGIAGGSGGGTPYVGVAPEAELIFISLRRDAPSLTDAVNYVSDYAQSVDKPFVVNMSFGAHLGPHDGMDLKNAGIDAVAGPGRVFVGSAGNNGRDDFHLNYNFNEEDSDTMKTVVQFVNTTYPAFDTVFGQTLSMWGSPNSEFSASVIFTDASNNTLYQTPFYRSQDEDALVGHHPIPGTNDSVEVRVLSTHRFPTNDKPNIRMEVERSGYKTILVVQSNNTDFHMWNNVRYKQRYTNSAQNLTDNYPGAVGGDKLYAPGEPAGCGKSVTTVASHRAETEAADGTPRPGILSDFSSSGPTVDERQKPNVSGPGQFVVSSVSSFAKGDYNPVDSVHFEGKTFDFASFSGTSMSGPATAGVAALMLQANPKLTSLDVRNILEQTARTDERTGDLDDGPDLRWGYGKVHAVSAVLMAETLLSTEELSPNNLSGKIYPNPAREHLNIEEAESFTRYTLYDVSGSEIKTGSFSNTGAAIQTLSLESVPAGTYLIRLHGEKEQRIEKLIVR